MDKKHRLRGPNFTNSDQLLLCDIVAKHKHIIENKKTDGANLQQKQNAWLEVVKEFNASTSGHSRTLESLQQNYKNLKKNAKKNASDAKMDIPVDRIVLIQNIEEYGTSSEGWEKVAEGTGTSIENCQKHFKVLSKEAKSKDKWLKKNILGTGGGPPPRSDDEPLLDKVKALVGPSIEGLHTIYDGDSDLMALQHIPPIELKNIIGNEDSLKDDNEVYGDNIDADERPSQGDTTHQTVVTPKTHVSQDDLSSYFTNDRANLKKKPHILLSRKRKLELEMPQKQSVSTRFNSLATEKLELVAMQKELLKCQLIEEKEKLQHNQLLRAMEMEDAKKRYEHNELIRQLQLQAYNK